MANWSIVRGDFADYWYIVRGVLQAYYLLAIINSDTLYQAVQPLMSKGQFGARNLHKHLWKLAIPEFDADNELHSSLYQAGQRAAAAAADHLTNLRAERSHHLTVKIARRELRAWLRTSVEGAGVEAVVQSLLNHQT